MLAGILLSALSAPALGTMPTEGLLRIENLDCISRQIPADKAQFYYLMARQGREDEAFGAVAKEAAACQSAHQWSDIQTRNAFRVAVMNGWIWNDGLIGKIGALGEFKALLDKIYAENVKAAGRQILQEAVISGKADRLLTAAGYPEEIELRELAYRYWEWRGALRAVEDDFRNGRLRR